MRTFFGERYTINYNSDLSEIIVTDKINPQNPDIVLEGNDFKDFIGSVLKEDITSSLETFLEGYNFGSNIN